MDACMETFATLVNFMTLMNCLMKVWHGLEQSVIMQWMSGTNISGHVFMPKEGTLSI